MAGLSSSCCVALLPRVRSVSQTVSSLDTASLSVLPESSTQFISTWSRLGPEWLTHQFRAQPGRDDLVLAAGTWGFIVGSTRALGPLVPLGLPGVRKGCRNCAAREILWDQLQSGAKGELGPVEMVLSQAAVWWTESVEERGELKIIIVSEVLQHETLI